MKNSSSKFHFYAFLLFLASGLIAAYSILIEEINQYITYLSIFFFAVSLTSFYIINMGNRSIKKMDWLEKRLGLWNSISYRVKKAGEKSFNEMPLGIIVYDENRTIQWANNYAKEIFLSPLVDRKIELISKDLYYNLKEEHFEIFIYGRTFECKILQNDNILYLVDKTEIKALELKYRNRTLAMGIINLDNLGQALTNLDAQDRAYQISNIIGILSEWCNKHDIYLKGYSETQYLILLNYYQLQELITEEFKILDEVKSYCLKENLRVSASIGIACQDGNYNNLFDIAESQLSLALNRGGNQCVVYIDGKTSYFGGKTNSFENRSPVYVRAKADDLRDLVRSSELVYIMPHIDTDADAFGASIALYKLVNAWGRNAKIIFNPDSIDQTVSNLYKTIQIEHVGTLDYLIDPKDAQLDINKGDLLIIVDSQYQNLLIDEKLFKKANKVAIIDHHRRSNRAIDDYDYLYTQTSASSSVELIVEMFEFIEEEIELSSAEATWMLMGVIVDTNNLMYRTSYRTFNVLSILQKYGAEMPKAQKYLRESFDEYVRRMNILNNLEVVDGIYGIAVCKDGINQRQFLAKVSDDIITINNIKASFTIGKISNNEVGISARSLDDTNVQLIMEHFGGGGHYNNAASQIVDTTIEEVKKKLIAKLKTIDDGGATTMKIILTADVKGKGKKGEMIEIPSGHANFLIRNNQAILATVDNIKKLETEKQQEKLEAEKLANEMRELKNKVDITPVTVGVKVGKEGKLFGTVSMKQVVDEYKNQNQIVLDKRKILFNQTIDALGTYKIPIQLYKDITATIVLHVIEKD